MREKKKKRLELKEEEEEGREGLLKLRGEGRTHWGGSSLPLAPYPLLTLGA